MRPYIAEIDGEAIMAYDIVNEENGGLQLGLNGSTGEIENDNAVTKYEFHALADLFPLVEGAAFEELVADIEEHGLADPIVLFEDKILDGRNRYRALERLGLGNQLRSDVYSGTDPLAFVISKNLKRRHLNDDQRRMVGAKIANLQVGANQHTAECGTLTRAKAEELLNTDAAGIERARTVIRTAEPEIQNAVEQGKLTVNLAAQASKLPPDQQIEIAKQAAAGEANVVRAVVKKARAQREVEPQPAKVDTSTESTKTAKPPVTAEQPTAEPPANTSETNNAFVLLGCLREFQHHGLLNHDPAAIVQSMSPDAANDVRRLAPLVVQWLGRIGNSTPTGSNGHEALEGQTELFPRAESPK